MKSPILFLIFNRPDTTAEVFETIRHARPPRLYIAADGPRATRPGEMEICEATRRIATNVDWPCEVKTLFRDENLGCGKAVSQAITWFFDNEPEGIIIEDDIIAHPDFFRYCDEMLDRYRDDERIQLITGRNAFYKPINNTGISYYMSSYFHIWGWATWRRVWNTYEFDAAKLSKPELMKKLAERIPSKSVGYWSRIIDMMQRHQCDTWDYQLYFNQIIKNRYTLIPYINMTANIGFGDNATHTSSADKDQKNHKGASPFPISHPNLNSDFTDEDADIRHMLGMRLYNTPLLMRVINKIRHFVNI